MREDKTSLDLHNKQQRGRDWLGLTHGLTKKKQRITNDVGYSGQTILPSLLGLPTS